MRTVIALLSVLIMGLFVLLAPKTEAVDDGPPTYWIKIVFGADGAAATWDGRLTIKDGEILDMTQSMLDVGDQLVPQQRAWKIATGIAKARRVSFAEPQREILVELKVTPETRLIVETKQGRFDVEPAKLIAGRPMRLLDGRAEVQRLGTEELVAETKTDDDFTAIAMDDNGHRHVAWVAYDAEAKADRLLIRDVDAPTAKPELITDAAEISDIQLLNVGGTLHAFWSSSGTDKNWDIYAASRRSRGWQTKRLTTAAGTDFQLSADRGHDGTVWLAWQSFRDGKGDIYAKRLQDEKWSEDIAVETNSANQWQPTVSVDSDGRAWIGFDSYENGNYDVYLTSLALEKGTVARGARIAVAQSEDFEAHANVLAGDGGRIWVAYDAAGPNWGKDFRNVPTINDGRYSEPLHASRRLELRCVVNGQVQRPTAPLPQVLPPGRIPAIERKPTTKPSRFYDFPQLARDGDGRIWLLFRMSRQGYCGHPPKGAQWNIYATTYTNGGWLDPIQLPNSQGRMDQRVATCTGPKGRLQCAWGEGNRFAAVRRKYAVRTGALPPVTEAAAEIPCEAIEVTPPGTPSPAPQTDLTINRGGEEFQVYFGDLHRHTNISRCSPTIDGCLTDAHRYALDAVEYDFLAVTDHTRDVDAFSWWRTQKAADWFHIPGRYVPIYGYERSNATPGGGHRNVFFLNRGADVSRSDHWYTGRNLRKEDADPDTTLYPWLRERGDGLTAAHTPNYDKKVKRGTWTYNDPQVEPVVEVFQGFRRQYVRPDSRLQEEASVWFALRKGYKLGFIASSDHISTHVSYACVWAKDKTREAIFDAIRARRTYAATDRIGLDVRIGEALMGEETNLTGDTVKLSIRAQGTAPITDIEVVRDGKVIETLRPGTPQVETAFEDKTPLPGNSYYYVRLLQDDGSLAWASPIWVSR